MKVLACIGSPLLRDVLRAAFSGEPGIEVTTAGSLAQLRAMCRQEPPNVVVAGTAFPDGELREAVAEVLLAGSGLVVVCDGEQAEAAAALLFAGAGGCLFVEDAGAAEVVAATREVAAGHAALHPAAAAAVLRQWRATHASVGPAREAKLSAREIEVLRAMAEGLPTKSVARALGVSPKTVEAHTARILARLGARNRAQAIAVAAEQGLLDIDSCAATGADR